MTIPSILMLLCIPFFGNGAYFLAFGNDGPECGIISLIFFNISFLCLFLPLLSRKVKDSAYLNKGENLFAIWYLVIESIVAFLFIYNNGSAVAASVSQFLLLGIFLVSYLRMVNANSQTDKSLNDFNNTKSQELLQARLYLQMALNSVTQPKHKEMIRGLIAEINSSPIHSKAETKGLEKLICEKSSYISSDSQVHHFEDISRLLNQRKILLFN